jgi:Cell shape-determining protein
MKIPPSFYVRLGRALLFISLECLCIIIIFNNSIAQRYKFFSTLRNAQYYYWEKQSKVISYFNLASINEQLSNDNILLRKELDKAQISYIDSNSIIVNDSTISPYRYINARVIRNITNTSHNYLIINKGRKDGVKEDMGIITPEGIVGITRGVSNNCTYVLSFLSPEVQVSAKAGKEGTFGSLSWDIASEDGAILKGIPQHIIINPNDTIYSSGYSSLFPGDIPLGIAKNSKIVDGTHKEIEIKLFQNFKQLDYVMVVNNILKKEIDSLIIKLNNE